MDKPSYQYVNEQDAKIKEDIGTLSELDTTAKDNLVDAVNELFTSVSNGKSLVASAITDKGVATQSDATFSQMATNILAIPTGGGSTVKAKTWVVTLASASTANVTVTTGDSDVMEHYADNDALAAYIGMGDISSFARTFGFNSNKTLSSNAKYGVFCDKRTTSNFNSADMLSAAPAAGAIYATANGDIVIGSSGSYPVRAGSYLVIFAWN